MMPATGFSPRYGAITISDLDLPDIVLEVVQAALDAPVSAAIRLTGGQVSPTARIDTAKGIFVVKWSFGDAFGRFFQEAQGLIALADAGEIRVPVVIATNHFEATAMQASLDYILIEYIPNGQPTDASEFSRRFARVLAGHHRKTAAAHPLIGLEQDNFLGSQPQKNCPRTTHWPSFYRDNRLLPQIERAKRDDLLSAGREQRLMHVVDQLDLILDGLPADVSLIHGDLWSGNFLCAAGDEPVLIDPAIYYAPREMELAYIELFGGFPPNFVENYNSAYTVDPGYPRRRSLHQLYPLLIHLNHFGEQYGPAVDRVCEEYLSN